MRPIVNAMDGPKKNISDTFYDIAAPVDSNDEGIMCFSTEELLETFESSNKRSDSLPKESKVKTIIGSMDAVSLFTSLEDERSAEIVRDEVRRSKVNFEDICRYP